MPGFRYLKCLPYCFVLFFGIVHAQEGFKDWGLTGLPRGFKSKPVARLSEKTGIDALLFETEDKPIILAKWDRTTTQWNAFREMNLPVAENQAVYEVAWNQLGGDPLSPAWKWLVDGAYEAFKSLRGEREDAYVAFLGERFLQLTDEERGKRVQKLAIQLRAAEGYIAIGQITKAKAIVSRIPESKIPISIWEAVGDMDRAADLRIEEAKRGYERFRKGDSSSFPLGSFESAIRLNIETGRAEKVTGLADIWLNESVKKMHFRSYPSVVPGSSPEVAAAERAKREKSHWWMISNALASDVALWWVSQSAVRTAQERLVRWETIKSDFTNEYYSSDHLDFRLAKHLVEFGMHEESEAIFLRLASSESNITESDRAEAEFELGRIAEVRGDWKKANHHYHRSKSNREVELLTLTFCFQRMLLLSLQHQSEEKALNLAAEAMMRRLSRKPMTGSTRGRHPFVLAALLRKLNPGWRFPDKITDERVKERLLHRSKLLPTKYSDPATDISSSILQGLALVEYGELEEAKRLAQWSFRAMGILLQPKFHHLDESARLEAAREIGQLYRLLWKVGMEDELRYLLYQYKGGVLDGILNDMELASRWPSGKELLNQLKSEQIALIDLELSSRKDREVEMQMTEKKISLLSRKLNLGVAEIIGEKGGTKRSGSYEELARRLPEDTVLVDYFLAPPLKQTRKLGAVYLAVVAGKTIESTIVEIGEPDQIDHHIRFLQESGTRLIPDGEVLTALRELNTLLVEPILRIAPKASRLIVSPDSLINNVPFVALLNGNDDFVGNEMDIRMVRTPRSLEKSSFYDGKEIAIYCRPDYQANVATNTAAVTRSVSAKTREGFRNFALTDLPGTEREAIQVQSILSNQGWDVSLQKGNDASEAALAETGSPRILHLATHGFYLPPVTNANAVGGSFLPGTDNEMLRVGLFLAGSQRTVNAWSLPGGNFPPSAGDGIVFAAELSQMRFPGTELVVLSACETGLGDVQSGEGVMGFSRALETAGVSNTLLTLWPVDDRATVDFMRGFYEKVGDGIPYGEALQTTQMGELLKFRSSQGIATAIRLAAPFQLLSSDSSVLK